MMRLFVFCIAFAFWFLFTAPASMAQSASISSLTAVPPPQQYVPVPIYAISRTSNVVTISTVDPANPDQFAQQSNQVGKSVTIAQVTVDPSNAVNGTFTICGPPTPVCNPPTTYGFSFVSPGANFSAASNAGTDVPLGITAVARTPCPLIPTGYFSFCGDPLPGAGLGSASDGSLVEFISTEDETGTTVWASSLGDGNTGSTRATGCEQQFIESGNEWHFVCFHQHWLGGYFDIDMLNQWIVMDVGDGLSPTGVGGQFAMSGTRKLAGFGRVGTQTLEIDMGATPSGAAMPTTGILRLRNGSSVCWENVAATNPLCQSTNANDQFSFDGGVSTTTYNTSTVCASIAAQCGTAAAGSFTLPLGSRILTVSTTAVTAQSQIFIQEDSSLSGVLGTACSTTAGRSYIVSTRMPGVGFTITANSFPEGEPACLSYHIMN